MVPVPLPPADVKANSVVMFFPSSSQQLQDPKRQALSPKTELQTAVIQAIRPAFSCFKSSPQNPVNVK